ncbi:hypothetical protein L0222_02790 [bacterium]|nr:hypothetical protein [bacterium]MCI0604790.1 hypothetical protein [bacterium]
MKRIAFSFVILLLVANWGFAYDLILKSGKVIQGTLVSENEENIFIKDKDGITLNFKKTMVDLQKTSEANKPMQPVVEEPKKPEVAEKSAEKPKKKARVYNAADINRLRDEYPLESGAGVQFEEGKTVVKDKKGLSGEEWQELTQSLLAQIKAAEEDYQRLSAKCSEFQGAAIQTHIAVSPEGKEVNLVEAKERACQAAEDAKAALESVRQEYANAVERARQENVLPGYIARED